VALKIHQEGFERPVAGSSGAAKAFFNSLLKNQANEKHRKRLSAMSIPDRKRVYSGIIRFFT
jgi:hypothetical protein